MERKNAATVYLIVIQAVIVKDRYNIKVTKDRSNVILVKLFLLCRHVYAEDLLHLGRQRFFHIFLDTSEKVRLKDFVKTLITIIPSFPMLIFKILPADKPGEHNRDNKCHSSLLGIQTDNFSTAFFQYYIKDLNQHVLVRHEEVQQ